MISRVRWEAAGAVAVPTVVAALLLLRHLGYQPLWVDEIATVSAARRPLTALPLLLGHTDAVLGPYYAFMHFWTELGTGAAWLRLPSLLGAVGSVGLVAALGTRLRGPLVGLVAGLLLATNPFVAFYAHDARPYTLVMFTCLLAATLVLPDPATASWRRRLGWAGAAAAAVCLHLFSVLAVAVQAVVALRSSARRRWLMPVAAVAAVALPLAVVALVEQGEIGWVRYATPATFLAAFSELSGGFHLAAVNAVLVAVALLELDRRWRLVLGGWLLLPSVVLVAVSFVKPVFVARYTLPAAPALALLAAVGLVGIGRRLAPRLRARAATVAAGGAAALVLTASATALAQQDRPFAYENVPAAADLVLDNSRPGDAIVFLSGGTRVALDYYLVRMDRQAPHPADVLLRPGGSPATTGTFSGVDLPAAVGERLLLARARVWTVSWSTVAGSAQPVYDVLRVHFRPVRGGRFGQAHVLLWSRTT